MPSIVVVAYDRPGSLSRLLRALTDAEYPEGNIPLVISLDHSKNPACRNLADTFEWPHGEKTVLEQPIHLGLKAHILQCGDLTKTLGPVILLEDDLLVAPHFYRFAQSALEQYEANAEIGGISLYAYEVTESAFAPFHPLDDDSDVYFLQFPSSWGQAWTPDQWTAFREWFAKNPSIGPDELIPDFLREWPSTSWKKHFARYLLAQDRYFVYPKISLSTNFSDPGTHADSAALFQVPLDLSARNYRFSELKDSLNRYDIFFELKPDALNQLTPQFAQFDYSVDLYGNKDPDFWQGEYLLTTRPTPQFPTRFGLKMFPPALNVKFQVEGSEIYFGPAAEVNPEKQQAGSHYYRWATVAPQLLRSAASSSTPQLSLIVPVHAPQANLGSVSSLRTADGTVEVILVHSAPIRDSFSGSTADRKHLVTLQVEADSSVEQMIEKGLEVATGELMGIVPQGSLLEKEAIQKITRLFQDFEQVNWIVGQPRHGKVARPLLSLAKQRILLDRVPHLPLADWLRALPIGQVFWRRSLWEKVGGRVRSELGKGAIIDLWARFWKQSPPTLVKQSWSAKILSPSYLHTAPTSQPDSLQSLTVSRSTLPGPFRKAIGSLFRPFFRWDVSGLRFAYYELAQMPDVLIYDPKSEKFYFWRY